MEIYILKPNVKQEFYSQLKRKTQELFESIERDMSYKDKIMLHSMSGFVNMFKDDNKSCLLLKVDNDKIVGASSYKIFNFDGVKEYKGEKKLYIDTKAIDELIGKEGKEIIELLRSKGKIIDVNIDVILNIIKSLDVYINVSLNGSVILQFSSGEQVQSYIVSDTSIEVKQNECLL